MEIDIEQIINRIEELKNANEAQTVENLLPDILLPLFKGEGYESIHRNVRLKPLPSNSINEWDMIISKGANSDFHKDSIGVEVKVYRNRKVDRDIVNQIINKAKLSDLKRSFIFSPNGFSNSALNLASNHPQELELYDFTSLRDWVYTLKDQGQNIEHEISFIIKTASKAFIEAIAKNPKALDSLEWRDLERLLAETFEGIGFSVTLTPSSKDGGKDIIIQHEMEGNIKSYIVEVKHWRCGNKVGSNLVDSFFSIVVKEKHEAGIFIATNGYTNTAFESLTKIEREKIKFGDESKIVSLCKTYLRVQNGLWSPEMNISDMLFESTI